MSATPDGEDGSAPEPGPLNEHPSGPGPLVVAGAIGAVLGWSLRPLSFRFDVAQPVVGWWSVGVVWALGVCVGIVALRTWRTLQRPRPGAPGLEPYQAVNRLVLGKAAAIAGAFVLGGYAGFAIAQLGITPTELGTQRLVRSAIAALGGLAILVAGLLLERACRVRGDAD